MTKSSIVRVVIAGAAVGLWMCAIMSCQKSPTTNSASPASSSSIAAKHGPTRDLSQDEAAGGHILRKHVGQTDRQLRERLEREPNITGASTYTDRAAAEHTVGAAIAESHDRIQQWLRRPGGHPNLVLEYNAGAPIGRTMNRGESEARPCTHALVVLKYAGPNEYYVLTSYPECRP